MIETFEFKQAEEFLEFISPWGKDPKLDGYIFRGHSQESYQLIPTALRPKDKDKFWKICGIGKPIDNQSEWRNWQIKAEYSVLRLFYRLADQRGLEVPVSNRVRKNLAQEFDYFGIMAPHEQGVWIPVDLHETAALAQHYGIPTSLLDWTYDLYVALFFAFKDAAGKTGNIVIWALNKEHLSFLKPTVNKVNIEFITPHYAGNPNLNAQKGLFTHWSVSHLSIIDDIHRTSHGQVEVVDRRPLNELIKENLIQSNDQTTIFKKFILPCSEASKGAKMLYKFGYDFSRLFPGYNGVAEQLLRQYE